MADDSIAVPDDGNRDLRAEGLAIMRKVMPGVLPEGDINFRDGGFADELVEMGLVSVWGQLWARDGLTPRDRSIVTLSLLIARGAEVELRAHLGMALTNGVTKAEIAEIIYHSSAYAGFPAAVAARTVARGLFDDENVTARTTAQDVE